MDNKVEEKDFAKKEDLSGTVVTMCLAGYRDTIKKQHNLLLITVICWLLTVIGFLWYLSQYEVEVTSYGSFENSHVNTSTGQQADTMTNYYQNGVDINGENGK